MSHEKLGFAGFDDMVSDLSDLSERQGTLQNNKKTKIENRPDANYHQACQSKSNVDNKFDKFVLLSTYTIVFIVLVSIFVSIGNGDFVKYLNNSNPYPGDSARSAGSSNSTANNPPATRPSRQVGGTAQDSSQITSPSQHVSSANTIYIGPPIEVAPSSPSANPATSVKRAPDVVVSTPSTPNSVSPEQVPVPSDHAAGIADRPTYPSFMGTHSQPSPEIMPPADHRSAMVFKDSQIRYCLSQRIRLQGAQKYANRTSLFDISRFNKLLEDYRSRCDHFKYRPGNLEFVRNEVETRRALLESEGVALLRAN